MKSKMTHAIGLAAAVGIVGAANMGFGYAVADATADLVGYDFVVERVARMSDAPLPERFIYETRIGLGERAYLLLNGE